MAEGHWGGWGEELGLLLHRPGAVLKGGLGGAREQRPELPLSAVEARGSVKAAVVFVWAGLWLHCVCMREEGGSVKAAALSICACMRIVRAGGCGPICVRVRACAYMCAR